MPFIKDVFKILDYDNVYADISWWFTWWDFVWLKTEDHINKKELLVLRHYFKKIKNDNKKYSKILFWTDYPVITLDLYIKYLKLIWISTSDIYNFSDNSMFLFNKEI